MFPSQYAWGAIANNIQGILSQPIIFYGLMLWLAVEVVGWLIPATKEAVAPEGMFFEQDGELYVRSSQDLIWRNGKLVPKSNAWRRAKEQERLEYDNVSWGADEDEDD